MAQGQEVIPNPREKTVAVVVRFWTSDIGAKGKIKRKHLWMSGSVEIKGNPSHEIVPGDKELFDSKTGLLTAIEKVLNKHGITIYTK